MTSTHNFPENLYDTKRTELSGLDKFFWRAYTPDMSNGKGDLRRPAAIPDHEVRQRWIETFGSTERAPLNPNVARARILEFEREHLGEPWDAKDAGTCERCGLSLKYATKCHRASWQKNSGPRRK